MELYQHTLVTAVGLNTAVEREEQCTIYVANNVSVCNAPGALTNAQAHNATMPRLVMHLKLVPRPMPRLVISRLQIQITMKCYKIDTCSTSQLSQIYHTLQPPSPLILVGGAAVVSSLAGRLVLLGVRLCVSMCVYIGSALRMCVVWYSCKCRTITSSLIIRLLFPSIPILYTVPPNFS